MNRHWTWCLLLVAMALCVGQATALDTEQEEAAPATYPGNAEEGVRLEREAVRQFQEHQYVEAARLFVRAWDAYQHPRYQYNVGQCYRHAERWDQAIAAYERRLELQPAPLNYIYAHIGYCHLQAHRHDEANRAFRRYLELEPEGDVATQVRQALEAGAWPDERRSPEIVQQARQVHDRARQLTDEDEFEQAAEVYLEGYQQFSQVHELLLNAGLCYMWARNNERAIEVFGQYLQTPGADTAAIAHLAECHMAQGDLPLARDTYQRYLQRDPDGEMAQQARQVIRFISRLDPMPTRADLEEAKQHVTRGNEHMRAGRYRRAQREYQAAYDIIPASSMHFNIGACLFHRGEYDEAVTYFLQYIERVGDEGSYASAHVNAAACLANLNRDEDAMQHIRAYRARADAAELPREQHYRDWATAIENQCKEDD
jgi:tetratricopeptide (TPR) repeat protein